MDALACGILEHLKSRSILSTTIPFRHDVFNYFFMDKGTKCNERGCILFEKRDFVLCCFPNNWDRIIDQIGNGVCIDFPVKIRVFLGWGPKNHTMNGSKILPLPRYRPEKISISFCKAACSLS